MLALVLVPCSAAVQHSPSSSVTAVVQPVLDAMSVEFNMSFSFGFADSSGQVGLASGVENVWDGRRMTNATPIPLGSTTKPWTTIAVLQAAEQSLLSLDDPAQKFLDPIMLRLNGTTFKALWGDRVSQITIRDLIGMTSGLGDYDDEQIASWTVANAGEDLGPFELLHLANKTFVCEPKTCGYYSSIGYVLLGLVMTEVNSLVSWQDFDQLSIIPPSLRRHYRSTTFPKLGRCQQYPTLSHQFGGYPLHTKRPRSTVYQIFDLIDDSCLNGWTMGNMASTGADMASFFYDLFATAALPAGQRLVGEDSLDEMLSFKPLVNSWCPGCFYGAGILAPNAGAAIYPTLDPARAEEAVLRGHPGEDWGSSSSPLCGYNPSRGFGVCLAYNSVRGMNCSKTYGENVMAATVAGCHVLDAVMSATGGPRLNCTARADPYPTKLPCVWSFDPPPDARRLGRAARSGLIHHQTATTLVTQRAFAEAGTASPAATH